MTQLEKIVKLNAYLLAEAPQYQAQAALFKADEAAQFRLFRSLVNIRMPKAASRAFLDLQDDYLRQAIRDKGITRLDDLRPVAEDLYLWQGDITTLAVDAIVNAANSQLLGCFCPCHGCIDNAIHTFAGVQLRLACGEIMAGQAGGEPTGRAKITPAFNLPCRYVLHTVGPIVTGETTAQDRQQLRDCYRACLTLADAQGCGSIAFCCISTGEFHFPNALAAELALGEVRAYKAETGSRIKVIFNVFKQTDNEIYRGLLGMG